VIVAFNSVVDGLGGMEFEIGFEEVGAKFVESKHVGFLPELF
jgi:hypothetical protein